MADFDTIERKKDRIEGVAKTLIDIAKEKDSNKVEANTRACGAYGGCPHREYCSAGNRQGIERLFGKGTDMGNLLNQVKKETTNMEPNVLDKLKALKDNEQKQKENLALRKAFETIETDTRGMPQLSGDAAKAWASYKNLDFSGQGYCGSGELAGINVPDVATLLQLAEELRDTPSEPSLAGLVPDNVPAPTAEVATEAVADTIVMTPEAAALVEAAPEKKKRGRKPKTDNNAVTVIPTQPADVAYEISLTTSGPITEIPAYNIYVDCVPMYPTLSLDPYVDELCRMLCNKFECADIRVAPKDGPLAFGGWRGVVRAYVLEKPPEPGSYTLFTGMREIAAEVADGMREFCNRNGHNFVKGVGR